MPILYRDNDFCFEEFAKYERSLVAVPCSGALPRALLFQTFCARLQPDSLAFLRSVSLVVDLWLPIKVPLDGPVEGVVGKMRMDGSWEEVFAREGSDRDGFGLSRLTGLRKLVLIFGFVHVGVQQAMEDPMRDIYGSLMPVQYVCRDLRWLDVDEICLELRSWSKGEAEPDSVLKDIEDFMAVKLFGLDK